MSKAWVRLGSIRPQFLFAKKSLVVRSYSCCVVLFSFTILANILDDADVRRGVITYPKIIVYKDMVSESVFSDLRKNLFGYQSLSYNVSVCYKYEMFRISHLIVSDIVSDIRKAFQIWDDASAEHRVQSIYNKEFVYFIHIINLLKEFQQSLGIPLPLITGQAQSVLFKSIIWSAHERNEMFV